MTTLHEQEKEFRSRFEEYSRTLDCVHCGLCIPYCPTHEVTGREADSPRGRIYLMRSYAESGEALSPVAEQHIQQCIVCRACETVCPSGIHMGEMMESFREELERSSPRWTARNALARFLLRHVLPYRGRIAAISDLIYFFQRSGLQKLTSAMLAKLSPRLSALDAMQPRVPPPERRRIATSLSRPEGYPAEGPKPRMRVGLFLGCIASEWFADAHHATIRVLQRNGCEVHLPDAQTCCGALHRHGGFLEDARKLYARNAEAFRDKRLDVIIVNAAGCGAALKEPPHGLEDGLGAPVRDVCEFLDEIGIAAPGRRIEKKVAYHQPCHLVHGQKIGPRAVEGLLSLIPGLALVPLRDSDRCCGSGGVYNLVHPEMAEPILAEKVQAILECGAELVVTGNPGCALQVRSGLAKSATGRAIGVLHPVELLDRAYGPLPSMS
ncbi:MAG TPA: (Fe-S)-binding protein [Planctomycetota bacterium]|nr:(Fe-S)-binding protein [Planctomycetota bacterium]